MPTPRAGADILIDDLPYVLYRPPNMREGDPLPTEVWDVQEVEPLNPSFGAPDLSYTDFPKSIESVVAFSNWTGGLSPTRLQSQPDTYWTSQGVDGRRPNQLILGPALVSVRFATQPSGSPLKQVDFGGGVYLIAGADVWKFNDSSRWDSVLNLPSIRLASFTDMAVFNNLLVATAVATNSAAGGSGAVSFGSSTLTDTSQTWTVNQWVGRVILAGGQTNIVLSNTATVLTMSLPWASQPANNSSYTIDTHLAYFTSADGKVWTEVSFAGTNQDAPKADFLATIRAQFWKAVKPNKLYSTTDPTTLSLWQSTATFVGDQTRNVTSLLGYNIDVAVGKEDGLWTLDRSSNDFPVVPELRNVADAKNGQNMKLWRTGLMFRIRNGLYRYQLSKLESIGLDRYRATGAVGAPKVLQVIDLAPYLNECFALLQPTDASSINLASFFQDPNRWHIFAGLFSPGQGTYLAASANAFSYPTLWVGRLVSGSYDTAYVRLPAATDNPLDDTGYKFANSGTITLPELQPIPDQQKEWAKVVLQALAAGTTGSVALSYAADSAIDTQTFTAMSGPQGQMTQSSVYQEWFFPASGVTGIASVTARSIQLRLTLANASGSDTPIVKHVVVHFKHRPQMRRRFNAVLLLEDGAAGRRHVRELRKAEVQYDDLLAARLSYQPVNLRTITGEQVPVFFEKLGQRLFEINANGRPRLIVPVVMLEHTGSFDPALPPKGTRL